MNIIQPQASPHVCNPGKVPSLMGTVILALLPATLFGVYLYGWPAFNTLVLCLLSALLLEALCLQAAGKPINTFMLDGSGVITALLLALALPPWAPWWIAVGGIGFAIVVGKHVFGGIGQNPFNPAMLARVALLLSFPVEMTAWINPSPLFSANAPGFLESLEISFLGMAGFDGITSASILGQVKTELSQGNPLDLTLGGHYSLLNSSVGMTPGSLGETSMLLLAAGGGYLLYHRIISWHVPTTMLASVALLSTLFYLIDPQAYAGPLYHLSSGGLMLGAFFIATDPVTSPSTIRGKLLFGAGCGLLVFVIRTWGGYPEGVAFAILLMNAITPLIDHYLRPRLYGKTRTGKPLPLSASPETTASPAGERP